MNLTMCVIISNENDDVLSSLNVNAIKKINGVFSSDEIVSKFSNFYYEKMILDITAIKDYKDIKNIQNLSINLDMSKLIILLDGSSETSAQEYISGLISMGIYNFTKNKDGIVYLLSHPNSYKDVANMHMINAEDEIGRGELNVTRVLGVKNLTEHAGSTTFIYMLKKQLEKKYRVAAIEIGKNDFIYFNDRNMLSVSVEEFGKQVLGLSSKYEVILVDLNESKQEKVCSDVLYLLEPSIIKINKLVVKNRDKLNNAKGKKVILNKSLLSPKDISEFEMEAGLKTFYSIPPQNDRNDSVALTNLLIRLGFLKKESEEPPEKQAGGIFSIFKHRS